MWLVFQFFLVILGAFLFQAAVVPHISFLGAKPDVILIIASLYGVSYGSPVGATAGFFGGLLTDLLAGTHVGVGLMSKTLVGFFAGLVKRAVFVENMLFPMIAIFIATWINEFIYVGFMFLLGQTVPIKVVALNVILPSAAYNAILTPFVYAAVRRFMILRPEATSAKIVRKFE